MAYLKNNKFLEIREAAKNNNEQAMQILQGLRKGFPQDEIDRMVNEYYAIPAQNDIDLVEPEIAPVEEAAPAPEPVVEEEVVAPVQEAPAIPDLTEVLDGELDGIISETELEDISFKDFLGNKRSDALKARKNADYFKAFDAGGREKYLTDKTEKYRNGFGNRINDIDRHFNDTNAALTMYSTNVNEMLDDDVELDTNVASQAYEDFTGNESAMHSFGRHWDNMDNENIKNILAELVSKYGKKNVQAALNVLMGDNEGYKSFRTNKIETEIGRYQKDLEKLLK